MAGLPHRALLEAQNAVIALMAEGTALPAVLTRIARLVEELAPPALCSILLLQPDGQHLRPGAGPSLPEAFVAAMEGLRIGPAVGSCGTAAFRKKPVIVTDIATDPLWASAADFVMSFGFRASWSQPILAGDGKVLGTIAMYYRTPRAPTGRDWGLLAPCANLVRLALAHHRKENELTASEARWRLAAEAGGLGMYDVNFITGVDRWTSQFKAVLGLAEDVTPCPKVLTGIVHPDDRRRFRAFFTPQPDGERGAPRRDTFRIRRPDTGEERTVVLRGRTLFASDGTLTHSIGTLVDITEQSRHQIMLDEARAAAENANRAKSRFLASMSHELRTPLNAIIGFADIMRHETFGPVGTPRYLGYLDDIHRSGEHLLSLINDVLDMAKIESGKLELHPEVLDLAEVAGGALAFLAAQATNAGVTLETRIVSGAMIEADRRALSQILINLLSNAVKFTPRGGIATVFAEPTAEGGLTLGVADTGIGMTPEGLAVAVEPFGQVAHVTTVEGHGTGLGLPIVKSLIESHGASFHIESAHGIGTRVWGEFPSALVFHAAA